MDRNEFLKKYIEKLGQAGSKDLQQFVLRLVRENEFYEDLLNLLDDGVLMFDSACNITFYNRRFAEYFALNHERVPGRTVDEVFKPIIANRESLIDESDIELEQSISKVIETDLPATRFFFCKLIPARFAVDNTRGYVGFFKDITQLRKSEEQRMQNARMGSFSLLAAGVAHEIGNPLNSLSIHLQLAEKSLEHMQTEQNSINPGDVEDLALMVKTCSSEVERLDYIIKNFLKTVRPMSLKLAPTDINEVIREVARFMEPEMAPSGTRLELELDDKLPSTMLDRIYIHKALMNIIKNAQQAIEHSHGCVNVRTYEKEGMICVEVNDNGNGIPQEDLSRIFDPYFTTKPEGSGLGLMIVHRSIKEHDGSVEVKSRPGEGTSFVIRLPVRTGQEHFLPPGRKENA